MMARVQSGIAGLDGLIGGGFPENTSVLVAGGTGSGKTIFCTQFLHNGIVEYGEKGVYISLEERPKDYLAEMKEFGWDLEKLVSDGKLIIIDAASIKIPIKAGGGFATSVGYDMEKLMILISKAIENIDAKRVVVDSIPALELGLDTEADARSTIYKLSSLLLDMGCTSLMTTETPEGERMTRYGVEEFIFRGVILLNIIRHGAEIIRTITVRKMRQTKHSMETCPITIGSSGITVHPGEKVYV